MNNIKLFKQFLSDNKVSYDTFAKRFVPLMYVGGSTLDGFLEVIHPLIYVSAAFNWRDTPEGNDYWTVIHMKWQEKLNE